MATSNQEQTEIEKLTHLSDNPEPNHLHSKLNAQITKQIDELEKEFFYEDRFQVDQVKLEKLMKTYSAQGKSNADSFFEQIMKTTQTQVEFLQLLTNDLNNKNHPYIRVSGTRMEDVTWAKGLILATLEVSNSVFRLKMAISNVDHHFIMGRNNNNINRIMDQTQTHIQFPDPNLVKKGNQITVHGTLEDLENARTLLRLSSPIVMSFELPTTQPIPSSERIGNYFKVQVMFSSSSKPNTLLVLIRGSTRRVDKLKKATRSLLNYALGKMANFTIVSVQLEVPPQHQESVKGENCENIISIMEHTNTKIFFPDLSIRGSRRSQVTITGSIDEVLMARAELVGNFPIELTFDISTENECATEIMDIGRRAGVCITISHKERDSGMSVTIKGSEKFIDTIYEVHRSIRQINSMFSYDKYNIANSMYRFEGAYQGNMDSVMDNYVENLVEQSDETTSEEWLSEQSPVISSPDSGGHPTQEEIQQNNWTIYDPIYNRNVFHHQESIGALYSSSPNYQHQGYNFLQPNVQETWIASSAAAIFNAYADQNSVNFMNYPQVQPQVIHLPELVHHQLSDWSASKVQEIPETSIQQAETEAIHLSEHSEAVQGLPNQHNSEAGFENEPQSPSSVISSPLIIGSEESVAGRLICTGWGNLF